MTDSKSPSPLNRSYLFALVVVLISAAYLGIIGILNYNPLEILLSKGLTPLNSNRTLRILYIIFGICAIYLTFLTKYHTFLPFLDKTVLPPSVLLLSEQANTNTQVTINARGAIKVVYWAAHSDENIVEDTPSDAYDKFENIGIAAVVDHKATLKLKCPTAYKVGRFKNRTLPKHVHYRLIYANGVLSEVHTLKLEKQCNNIKKNIAKIPIKNNKQSNDDDDDDDEYN
jgi:uncharacterized membrane protein YuzA (DUF378 family)